MNEKLFVITATQVQLDKLLKFIDDGLKKSGVAGLAEAVDLYNMVSGAREIIKEEKDPTTASDTILTEDQPKV